MSHSPRVLRDLMIPSRTSAIPLFDEATRFQPPTPKFASPREAENGGSLVRGRVKRRPKPGVFLVPPLRGVTQTLASAVGCATDILQFHLVSSQPRFKTVLLLARTLRYAPRNKQGWSGIGTAASGTRNLARADVSTGTALDAVEQPMFRQLFVIFSARIPIKLLR